MESRESIIDILKDIQTKVDVLTENEKRRKNEKEELKRVLEQQRLEIEEDRVLKESIL